MLIETEKDLRINQLRLIVFVMIALSIIMSIFTVSWLIGYNKLYGEYSSIQAEIVDQKLIEGINYDVYQYTIGNNTYKVTADWKSDNEIGDTVKLYYDDHNHLNIVSALDSRRLILPIVSSVFMVICIALVVVYIWIRYSHRREMLLAILRSQQMAEYADEGELDSSENHEIDIEVDVEE